MLSVNLYLDIFNFAIIYYITQIQDGKIKPLIYNLFTLFLVKYNYNIYQHKLVTIIKLGKRYSHILNAK